MNTTYLPETFLSRPYRGMNDLQEELSRAGIKDKDRSIDWLCRQVSFKRLQDK